MRSLVMAVALACMLPSIAIAGKSGADRPRQKATPASQPIIDLHAEQTSDLAKGRHKGPSDSWEGLMAGISRGSAFQTSTAASPPETASPPASPPSTTAMPPSPADLLDDDTWDEPAESVEDLQATMTTVSSSFPPGKCNARWEQCGPAGSAYDGATCCQIGSECKPVTPGYYNCQPMALQAHVVPWYGACGGANYNGPTECLANSVCVYLNPYFAQCLPAGSADAGMGAYGEGNGYGYGAYAVDAALVGSAASIATGYGDLLLGYGETVAWVCQDLGPDEYVLCSAELDRIQNGTQHPAPSEPCTTAELFAQCNGGADDSATCCPAQSQCVKKRDTYSQCEPVTEDPSIFLQQCGGANYEGPRACSANQVCYKIDAFLSSCIDASLVPCDAVSDWSQCGESACCSGATQCIEKRPDYNQCVPNNGKFGLKTWSGQCGGLHFDGPTTCSPGTTCEFVNKWYFGCSSASLTKGLEKLRGNAAEPETCTTGAFQQCDGSLFTGAKCCEPSHTCVSVHSDYSQCRPDTDLLKLGFPFLKRNHYPL